MSSSSCKRHLSRQSVADQRITCLFFVHCIPTYLLVLSTAETEINFMKHVLLFYWSSESQLFCDSKLRCVQHMLYKDEGTNLSSFITKTEHVSRETRNRVRQVLLCCSLCQYFAANEHESCTLLTRCYRLQPSHSFLDAGLQFIQLTPF